MKKSRFSEEKIIAVLKQADAGVKVAELVRKNGISEATFYNWKVKYGGLDVLQLRKLKELEIENARLKKMYAELSLAHHALQDAVEKNVWSAPCSQQQIDVFGKMGCDNVSGLLADHVRRSWP